MIGIFDSGVGGLTVYKAIREKLPKHDVVYFADLARAPYGTKSKEAVQKFSSQITDFLIKKGAKLIVMACNTASANAHEIIENKYKMPVFNVIEPAVFEAFEKSNNKKIGVIGTKATIDSQAYEDYFSKNKLKARIISQACPLLAPLIEEGYADRPEAKKIAKRYLRKIKDAGVDTLVLGCTHYPLMNNAIKLIMGKKVKIVNSSSLVNKLSDYLANNVNLEKKIKKNGKFIFYASDISNNFETIAKRFLNKDIKPEKLVDLDDLLNC